LKKLDVGYIDMNKMKERNINLSSNIIKNDIDNNKLVKAEMKLSKRHKTKTFVNMKNMSARDDKMYRVGEWYNNCINEKYNDTNFKLKKSLGK